MYQQDQILRLVGLIYDAVLTPERWQEFLDVLAETLDGHIVSLSHISPNLPVNLVTTARTDPAFTEEYARHYADRDPWVVAGRTQGLLKPGIVRLGEQIVSPEDLRRTDFYNGLGRRYNVKGGVACLIAGEEGLVGLSACQREFSQFDQRVVELFALLLPHLDRAFSVHRRFTQLTNRQRATADLLDRMPTAAILVDAAAKPLLVNRAATQLLGRRDGLTSARDGLAAHLPAETRQLRRLVFESAQTSAGTATHPGGTLRISRKSLKRPLDVLVTPLRLDAEGAIKPNEPAAILLIHDPASRPRTSFRTLKTLYGLTPAEARVATLLVTGATIPEISDTLKVSPSTIRTHVKRLFAKTGVRTQSQAVQVLLTGPASLDVDSDPTPD